MPSTPEVLFTLKGNMKPRLRQALPGVSQQLVRERLAAEPPIKTAATVMGNPFSNGCVLIIPAGTFRNCPEQCGVLRNWQLGSAARNDF
jgi:hypothetical protein